MYKETVIISIFKKMLKLIEYIIIVIKIIDLIQIIDVLAIETAIKIDKIAYKANFTKIKMCISLKLDIIIIIGTLYIIFF